MVGVCFYVIFHVVTIFNSIYYYTLEQKGSPYINVFVETNDAFGQHREHL